MNETEPGWRPWHEAISPIEALFQHFTAEIAALKEKLGMKPSPGDVTGMNVSSDAAGHTTMTYDVAPMGAPPEPPPSDPA